MKKLLLAKPKVKTTVEDIEEIFYNDIFKIETQGKYEAIFEHQMKGIKTYQDIVFLGGGISTVVLLPKDISEMPKESCQIEQPVIVITNEKFKREIYKESAGLRVVDIDLDNQNSEFCEKLKKLNELYDIDIFLTERMYNPDDKELIEISAACCASNTLFSRMIIDRLKNEEMYEEIRKILNSKSADKILIVKNNISKCIEKENTNLKLVHEYFESILRSCEITMRNNKEIKIAADIYESQFMKKQNGQIVCIDPLSLC